jgi:hypothetical protein
MPHTVGKLLTRDTTLLHTSYQLEVFRESYGPSKLRESQVWEFQDSHLGVLGQNAIWIWPSWRGIKYTIKGKWWLPPSLSRGESCESELPMARPSTKSAPTMHNHLVLVLCRSVWVLKACQFFLVPSRSSSMPLYPSKVLWARERAPTPCSSAVFCLELTFESFKELGSRQR